MGLDNTTAEEKLKELYDYENDTTGCILGKDGATIHISTNGGIYIAAEHIDLIANLVIERLKDGQSVTKETD